MASCNATVEVEIHVADDPIREAVNKAKQSKAAAGRAAQEEDAAYKRFQEADAKAEASQAAYDQALEAVALRERLLGELHQARMALDILHSYAKDCHVKALGLVDAEITCPEPS